MSTIEHPGIVQNRVPKREHVPTQHTVLDTLLHVAELAGDVLDVNTPGEIENVPDESLAAVVDHGALEVLDRAEQQAFVRSAFAKLQPGGMYSLFYRTNSRDEPKARAKVRELLESLFPAGIEYVLDWNETVFGQGVPGGIQHAWSTIVRKPGSAMSVMNILDRAMYLKREGEDQKQA